VLCSWNIIPFIAPLGRMEEDETNKLLTVRLEVEPFIRKRKT
jgi:hypothetical protein